MAIRAYVYNSWVGGQATDKKTGQANAFADSQSLDFRKSPSQLSVLPGTRRADNGVVLDLIQNEVMTEDGTTYSVDAGGNVYRCSPAGIYSLFGNIGSAGTFGINYRQDQDAIYITGTTSVSVITKVSTTPTLLEKFYGESQSTYDNTSQAGFNVNSSQSGGTQATAILTGYGENNTTEERFFQTDIQPISKIGVNILSTGLGDWTLVVHDGLNTELATKTILNADLVAGTNYFVFPTPIQVNVGPNSAQTYHFHLTSTAIGGSISSSSANNLSTCDMELWADRLVETKNGIHAQVTFQQFECILNGRYLSVWENLGEAAPSNSAWQRQKLSFLPGYEGYGETLFNEYLVIATGLTTTGDNTAQKGVIYYWDGLSDTYNYFTVIPEGIPQSIHEFENAIYYEAGGSWYVITSVAATPQKIRRFPGNENVFTGSNVQTQVYPYMGTVRYGIHLLGWPSVTGNPNIPYGVYSWGKTDYLQPNSFGYSYILSTGSQFKTDTNNLTIGMVKNFGNILHISWRDGDAYGVDVVDANSKPASFAKLEELIEDNKIVTKQKQGSYVDARWLDIQDGVEIILKYSINRGDWVYSERFSNDNLWSVDDVPNYARFDIGDGEIEARHYELQIGMDIYCDDTVTEAPVIVGLSAPFDTLDSETLI